MHKLLDIIVLVLGTILVVVVLLLYLATLTWPASRPYVMLTPAQFPKNIHTHVCTIGLATIVKQESDGDLHVRIVGANGAFIVAEEIPGLKPTGDRPKAGSVATACGISRYDAKHKWFEVHPVESWEDLSK